MKMVFLCYFYVVIHLWSPHYVNEALFVHQFEVEKFLKKSGNLPKSGNVFIWPFFDWNISHIVSNFGMSLIFF